MDGSTFVAVCATVVAVASLAVSVYEGRATRRHNRHSVRPILALRSSFHPGHRSGIRLINAGLGPAALTSTLLMLDGETVGEFSLANFNRIREGLTIRPVAATYRTGSFLSTDFDEFLLSVDDYDPERHREFREFVRRIRMEIHYESIYGGEDERTILTPPPTT